MCTGLAIVLHRSEHLACAESQFAAVPRALPAVKCGHTRLERDVHDPPEYSDADAEPMLALMLARLAG